MRFQLRKFLPVSMLLLVLITTGCLGGSRETPPSPPSPAEPQAPDLAYTQAAETIIAELTQNAPPATATPLSMAEAAPSATPTEEALPQTSTPLPTNTPLPSDTPLPTNTPLPTDTPPPLESPTPTLPPEPQWTLVYQDDFTSQGQFWAKESTEDFSLHYGQGGYIIKNKMVDDIAFSVRTDSYSNVRVEASAQPISGPLEGYYGLLCNFANGSNYYMFAIGVDGWYGIGVKRTRQMTWLKEGIDTINVRTGNALNLLRADCYQGMLVMWVNGVQIASVKDTTFSAGGAGFAVGTRKAPGLEVVFDDLMIYTAQK